MKKPTAAILVSSVLGLTGAFAAANHYHNTAQEQQARAILESMAGGAPHNISRFDMIKATCESLPESVNAAFASRNSPLSIRTEFEENGTYCTVSVKGSYDIKINEYAFTENGMMRSGLEQPQSPADFVASTITRRHTVKNLCEAMDNIVIPALQQAGVDETIKADLYSGHKICFITVAGNYNYFADNDVQNDGTITQYQTDRLAKGILNDLSRKNREIARDILPAMLKPQQP
ncbi:MAG: hypothetical protein H6869_09200 [Rhodospirillales bacterium]|nr:hypothetical protein [Rhodospirillales bacterium]